MRVVVAVVLTVGAATLAFALVSRSPDLAAPVAACTTVLLLGVTAWYVVLTRNLVLAQHESIDLLSRTEADRRRAEARSVSRSTVRELWVIAGDGINALALVREPIERELGASPFEAVRAHRALDHWSGSISALGDAGMRLSVLAPDVPDAVSLLSDSAAMRCIHFSSAAQALKLSLAVATGEVKAHSADAPTIDPEAASLDAVKRGWNAALRHAGSGSEPAIDWQSVISGSAARETKETLEELQFQCFRYLRDTLPRETS
jgi:hypothetical protein